MPRELSLADIFQLGYCWETKILLTAVKLDLFSALGGKQLTVTEVVFGPDSLTMTARAVAMCGVRCGTGGPITLARRPGRSWRVTSRKVEWIS